MFRRRDKEKENSTGLLSLVFSLGEDLEPLEAQVEDLHSRARLVDESLSQITRDGVRVSEILDEMGKLSENLRVTAQLACESTELAAESSGRFEEKASRGSAAIEQVIRNLREVAEKTFEAKETYRQLGDKTREVGENLQTTAEIATLTEESARNAEIKAFHAGDSGRGFGVVAQEMTRLATSSIETSERAPILIQNLRQKTDEMAGLASSTSSLLARIPNHISPIKEGLERVRELFHETLPAFEEIEASVESQRGFQDELSDLNMRLSELAGEVLIAAGRESLLASGQRAGADRLLATSYTIRELLLSLRKLSEEERLRLNVRNLLIAKERFTLLLDRMRIQVKELQMGLSKTYPSLKGEDLQPMIERVHTLCQKTSSISGRGYQIRELIAEELKSLETIDEEMESTERAIQELEGLTRESLSSLTGVERVFGESQTILADLSRLSEKTALFSLYAAVEAARAGSHRKDLEVSVLQTRDLSEQSKETARSISALIEDMASSLRGSKTSVQHSLQLSGLALRVIAESKSAISGTRTSLEELNDLNEEIVKAAEVQKEIGERMSALFDQLTSTLEDIAKRRDRLVSAIEKEVAIADKISSALSQGEDMLETLHDTLMARERRCYRAVLPGDPVTLDPALASDSTSTTVVRNLFCGLISFSIDTRLVPGIAESWQLSEDGRTWTFQIREGVKFHNGEEVTSGDVFYSFERALRGPNAHFFDQIEGAEEFMKGETRTIKGIKVTGRFGIEITLTSPCAPFLANLATGVGGIIPKGVDPKEELPIGAGPFRLKRWLRGDRILLEPFRDYYEGMPYVDELQFLIKRPKENLSLFRQGKLDHVELRPAEIEKLELDPDYRGFVVSQPSLSTQYVGFNLSLNTPFREKAVRQALNFAVDREDLLKTTAGGRAVVAKGVFPPGLPSYNPNLESYSYDPERARVLLEEAGYPNGLPSRYQLDLRDSELHRKRGKLIRDYFETVGVKVTLNPLPWEELLRSVRSGESTLFMMGWISDTGDSDNFLYPLFFSENRGERGNSTFYNNPKVDELILNARGEKNPHQRLRIYQEAEKLIVEDPPWIFLFHPVNSSVYRPGVHGFRVHPLSFVRLDEAWFDS